MEIPNEAQQPFEIRDVDGVKIIYGALPLDVCAQLFDVMVALLGEETVLDTSGLAKRYGANYAVGLPSDVERLVKQEG